MKKRNVIFTSLLSASVLFTGFGLEGNAQATDVYPSMNNERAKEEIEEMKAEGMTSEQIKELYEMSKKEYDSVSTEEKAEAIFEESQKDIDQYIKDGVIDEYLPKYNEEKDKMNVNAKKSKALGIKGDVLVSYDLNSSSSAIGFGHAAIVSRKKAKTVEAWHKAWSPIKQHGVRRYTNNWGNRKKVYGLRVNKSNNTKYVNAAKYAEKQAEQKKPYNLNFFDKKTTKKFYCSQLAWRAWKNQGHDIDNLKVDSVVSPMELVNSNNTKVFYHKK
ncbi:YiiX/YebB-like N1pC/P60 family cysteine hydrolase [Bacillus pumilus]|uniref:YiiX/YebB-like N1pC/P60 family cysteine hydrolase n=1 Tax=Bacillus pumilus TaxID=1408 RepID=UPI0011E8B5F0|nr:YiiX/YebB-like N1pC/P60 family cysteine hydrolase [Bacillus pumilus]TYS31046.1 septation ring formation regulator EzrA [Bacillus pumilus]TYS45829.1 septation ring formation regulator EzrA [Bacillus pumilus]